MYRIFVPAGVVVATLFLAPLVTARDRADSHDEPSVWMRKKLDYSKEILEGLTWGDFELVARNAEAMNDLSKFESFARGKSSRYRAQLRLFQDANREIIRQANRDNIEGVTLAFNQLTNSCVNCHKQLRALPGT